MTVAAPSQAPVQSTATADLTFTEQEISWTHTQGATGSGTFLVAFVGSIDTASQGRVEALSAVFEGASSQMMTLAHELTGGGRSFPGIHIFTLPEPNFSGSTPNTSGTITVSMNEVVTNIGAFSVVVSGVNTTAQGYVPGSFTGRVEHNLTSTGTLSGTVNNAADGHLLIDCVLANAGLPDDHTINADQILDARLAINTAGSTKMSISHKFASTAGHTKGMQRSDLTALETVSEVKFAIEMN
jgi:hypothetical protein